MGTQYTSQEIGHLVNMIKPWSPLLSRPAVPSRPSNKDSLNWEFKWLWIGKKCLSERQREGQIAPSSRYNHLLANSDAFIYPCVTLQRGEEPCFCRNSRLYHLSCPKKMQLKIVMCVEQLLQQRHMNIFTEFI